MEEPNRKARRAQESKNRRAKKKAKKLYTKLLRGGIGNDLIPVTKSLPLKVD